jgi:hypothetical protein
MVKDGWESIRAQVARLMGRGTAEGTETAAARLEESRTGLVPLSGTELDRAQAEQAIVWRTRLADLLEQHAAAETELRALITVLRAASAGSDTRVEQRATASDHAQQAVLGQGVQNNSFGNRDG